MIEGLDFNAFHGVGGIIAYMLWEQGKTLKKLQECNQVQKDLLTEINTRQKERRG